MAFGKAKKQYINKMRIIQPKLDKKIMSDEFYEDLKNKKCDGDEKMKLLVYNHYVLDGIEMTKDEWITWLEARREIEIG